MWPRVYVVIEYNTKSLFYSLSSIKRRLPDYINSVSHICIVYFVYSFPLAAAFRGMDSLPSL